MRINCAQNLTLEPLFLAQGDTAFAPLVLGWNEGNFHWNFALFGFAPTGHYSTNDLANTSLNH